MKTKSDVKYFFIEWLEKQNPAKTEIDFVVNGVVFSQNIWVKFW